ncbi:MAG: hypothetical protein ACD_75C01737G0004 [uncultured bacterium]|nr:MAG: hypothetical protein ACD_75C01737G0004 [uncultured bacterium]
MGHQVGERRSHDKTTEIDHAGPFTDNRQHFVSHPLGQTAFGEDQTDNDGAEDEEDRRIHEILEGYLRFANEKHGLGHSDRNTGNADRQYLENPPGGSQGKYRQSSFTFLGQNKMIAFGIDGVGPSRAVIDYKEKSNPQNEKKYSFPVERGLRFHCFDIC